LRFAVVAVSVALGAGAVGYLVGSRVADGDRGGNRSWIPESTTTRPAWLEIPAPDPVFRTATGDTARLSDLRGRIVLLNFWGSWCPPCLIEIPHLIEVQEALLEIGGTIVGPAVDSGSGDDVLRFAGEKGINYPVWLSDYETAVGEFGAAGYPFTVLIDREGIIRRRYLGPQTAKTLLRDIRALAGAAGTDRPDSVR
jgi:thiol-disulfide isomerase/thioredoxin